MAEHSDLLPTILDKLAPFPAVLVAFSGGVDSSVLLHLCHRLRQLRPEFSVRAVYIHHGLSQYADAWAAHCLAQCDKWQVPCNVIHVTLPQNGEGIEAAARQARYQAIAAHILPQEVLLTAQHLDDQCETFLLALKRGSGPAGLSAMPELSTFANQFSIFRPLLAVSRQHIEDYARDFQLTWVEDDSNASTRFERNFLRLDVLPTLHQRWPHFATMVARSAELCAEQEQLLDDLLAETLAECVDADKTLDIERVAQLSDAKRGAILRRWLALHQVKMPSREQLKHLWLEVALARGDADPVYLLAEKQIRRFQQRLYLLPVYADISSLILPWQCDTPLILPDNLGALNIASEGLAVRAPKKDEIVTIRFAASGKIHPIGRAGSRKIKKIWQEWQVPPWNRQRIPLLYYNETLIAAIPLFVTDAGAIDDQALFLAISQ